MRKTVLIASHGSVGALSAEHAAFEAVHHGDKLHHLFVVPSWWQHMTGDDWLNNGITRDRYCAHIEQELDNEFRQVRERVVSACVSRGVEVHSECLLGESEAVLCKVARAGAFDQIFIGSRRPKITTGLSDRMLTKKVMRQLGDRLQVIAHPDA